MKLIEKRASLITIAANTFLFILKISVGLTFNTISLISDAMNSLTDIIASTAVYISIIVSHQEPDKDHQFGHTRSQPLAGFLVAIFTAVVGFEILQNSLTRLITKEHGLPSTITIYTICLVAAIKLGLFIYTYIAYNANKSIALKANLIDHRNDIFIAGIVFIGLFTFNHGYYFADAGAGILISFYILYSGYKIARENMDFIMGIAPPDKVFELIEKTAKKVRGVYGLNDIRAHMLGTKIECEVHIYVDPTLNIQEAHDIGKRVQDILESIDAIQRAYIHIDPAIGEKHRKRRF